MSAAHSKFNKLLTKMGFLGTLVVWSIKPLKITAINRKCKLVRPSLLPYDAQDVNSKKDAQAFVAASRNLSCTCLIYYGLTYSFFVLSWYIYIYQQHWCCIYPFFLSLVSCGIINLVDNYDYHRVPVFSIRLKDVWL